MLILANTFYTSYKTQRALLIEQTLETNHAYASKLVGNIESFLATVQQQLAFAVQDVFLSNQGAQALGHIVERLIKQTSSFNSVLFVDSKGKFVSASKTVRGLLGEKLRSAGFLQALKQRQPLISQPFNSEAKVGRSMVLISHSVFDAQGTYLGFVGGTIYLNDQSVLHTLLGEHYQADRSVNLSPRLIPCR